ncbi:serine/threonine-protein kinase TBK1 [Anthonomus grandis grandis]|uniref:serine/threonine-protein kinase TBK1 n=1 Tax=Anthonomus grandis grandis TaxID=2921223 RepID=UPI002165163A|nr:serine/threonine-protein kinase TBK1 [Anthonomus grandis grandis]
MSSYLRGSTNYVWSTTSILGKGATATVHQGVNKVNGEPVAVKTFNHISTLRPQEVQLREFEVLRKVNHENIVKLLAIEEEQENKGKVIVMELCTGGSLFNILDDPENTYGLEEGEFLLVLEHLYAGMKHLRDNNLVHRDLKPGNIMKFIKDDGTTVYKLTDFGAARELPDGQQFVSLYGTEEYLHPDMYERAVLRKNANKTFGATIDLWSIGVTLYHVATGNLPFRPYGGRRNKETMHHITTKKESGVISGIQTKENGPIEWKRDLPVNCQLSMGLKKIVTPLLAGLLEADHKKIWSFDRFFKEVDLVLCRKPINIFHINKSVLIKVYIDPKETYQQLQEYINEQTDITPENQIILHQTNLFTNLVEEYVCATGFPQTTEQEPLFLFSKENNNVNIAPFQELAKFNEFSTVISVENDASHAKFACSIGHQAKRQIERYSLYSKLIRDTVDNFTKYINTNLKELYQNAQNLKDKTDILENSTKMFELAQKLANYNNSKSSEDLTNISKDFNGLILQGVSSLYKKHFQDNDLKLQWDSLSRELGCPHKNLAPNRAKTLVEHLRDSWQHLVRDRATRTLSYNDEQFHILERIKITETMNRIRKLLEQEVFAQYEALSELFGDWYKMAQNVHLKSDILASDVDKYEFKLKDFEEKFTVDCSDFSDYVAKCDTNIEKKSANSSKGVRNLQNQKLKKYLQSFKKDSDSIKDILATNTKLMNILLDSTSELKGTFLEE